MEIKPEDIKFLEEHIARRDWETVHGRFDDLMEERLTELDPEFIGQLKDITKNATFWFA